MSLAADGQIAPEVYRVPVYVRSEDDAAAHETSLHANIERVPLHEVDEYEAFAELADSGLSEGDIASRFGIDKKRVRQRLALGRLSPLVRDAWREGAFDASGHSREIVEAFTLGSLTDQERVFKKLKKQGLFWPHTVHQELGADNGELKLRRSVYPGLIRKRSMTPEQARREIAVFEDIARDYIEGWAAARLIFTARDGHSEGDVHGYDQRPVSTGRRPGGARRRSARRDQGRRPSSTARHRHRGRHGPRADAAHALARCGAPGDTRLP